MCDNRMWFGESVMQTRNLPIRFVSIGCLRHRVEITELLEDTLLDIGIPNVILPSVMNRMF